MDFGRKAGFSGGNVGLITVPEIPSSNGFDQWVPGSGDQSIWATEDDYRNWIMGPSSETPSSSNYDDRPNQTLSGSEPPNKKSRNSLGGDSYMIVNNRSKAIGKMFFKTKLCCKFRAGVCPYVTHCNFAHGMEELRKPPFNWQEIVAAAHEEGHGGVTVEPREEHQIPTFSSSDFHAESQRSYKGRHCKKFYTEEGCPYGDNCTFLHDEQSRARESVAISLSPTVGGEYGNNGNAPNLNLKPSNWKTRICNKWETTGHCPFGSKCHFAHGGGELHKYGGGLAEAEGMDSSSSAPPRDTNLGGVASKRMTDMASAPHSEVYHMGLGVPSQRLASNSGLTHQRLGERSLQKWKGPDKISRIYGDWLDDIE